MFRILAFHRSFVLYIVDLYKTRPSYRLVLHIITQYSYRHFDSKLYMSIHRQAHVEILSVMHIPMDQYRESSHMLMDYKFVFLLVFIQNNKHHLLVHHHFFDSRPYDFDFILHKRHYMIQIHQHTKRRYNKRHYYKIDS